MTSTLEPFPPDVEVVTNNWENKAEDGYNIGPARKITFRSTQGESSKQMQDRIEHIYGSRNWGTGGDSALRFGQGGPGEAFVQYGRWC